MATGEVNMFFLTIASILLIGSGARKAPLWNQTWTDLLKQDLLMNYDKYSRPSHHLNKTTVRFMLTLNRVDIEEAKSIMTVNAWMATIWNDDKLKWKAEDYDGIKEVRFSFHEVWQPDVELFNSYSMFSILDSYGRTNPVVKQNGEVLWVPPCIFQAFCELDLSLWPFDTQHCSLIFGSSSYSQDEIDIEVDGDHIDISQINEGTSEWNVTETEIIKNIDFHSCCDEPYVDVEFRFTLVRRSPIFKKVIFGPLTAIILVNLAGFWLPPTSGVKITLNSINMAIICLFLVYFATQLPVLAFKTPLIILFYGKTLCLVTLSILTSVFTFVLARNKSDMPLPNKIKRLLDGRAASILLGLGQFSTMSLDNQEDQHSILNPGCSSHTSLYWFLLAVAIDRLAFYIYCCIFLILSLIYLP